MPMLEEVNYLIGLEVYTPWGVRVGDITNIEIDIESSELDNLYIEETNDLVVERGESIMVPYRWIQSVGDIVILRYFPEDLPIPANDSEFGREYRG